MSPFNRRAFLKSIGVGAAGMSILPSVVSRAAEPERPLRFLAFFTPNGSIPSAWATPGATETTFSLGPILEPLAPFREKLLLMRGLNVEAAYEGPGAGHQKGTGGFLTGRPLNEGSFGGGGGEISGWASGISIDQEIANALARDLPHKSLELGVRVGGSNNRHRIAYAGSDQPLPPDDDPKSVFARLFGKLAGEDPAIAERLRRRRQSVLDFVKSDLGALQTKLGKQEWDRLQAHLDSVRDVEHRLEMMSGVSCQPPGAPPSLDHRATGNFGEVGRLQMDLLTAAFSCDLVRYATLLWSGGTSGQRFPWIGVDDSHHELSHAGDSDTTARGKLVKINRWYAEQLAYLLAKLDAIPEAGGTMLDNTVILWGGELAIGNKHSRRDHRWLIAGSGGGFFETGRFVDVAGGTNNNLCVSIAQAMGHPISSFGLAKYSTGPIAKLHA
jgi:hypothetical protein